MNNRNLKEFLEDPKNRILILLLGIALVVGFLFFSLQLIWQNDSNDQDVVENSEQQTTNNSTMLQIGNYSKETSGTNRMLKEYFSEVFKLFSSGTKEEIFSKVSKDYIKEYGYSDVMLYNRLKNKNIIGKAFQCLEYSEADNPRFGRIYSLEISSIDSKVLDSLIIIEDKPRSYKISFDGYIGEKDIDVEVIREGVKLNLTKAEEAKSRVYFNINIQNMNQEYVILNYKSLANEAIFVELSNGTKIYNSLSLFDGKELRLEAGQILEGKVGFLISDLQSAFIKKMSLVNVYNPTTDTYTTYEYQIY